VLLAGEVGIVGPGVGRLGKPHVLAGRQFLADAGLQAQPWRSIAALLHWQAGERIHGRAAGRGGPDDEHGEQVCQFLPG